MKQEIYTFITKIMSNMKNCIVNCDCMGITRTLIIVTLHLVSLVSPDLVTRIILIWIIASERTRMSFT